MVEKYKSKYSFGRSKVGGSKYRKGRIYENGTEKVEFVHTTISMEIQFSRILIFRENFSKIPSFKQLIIFWRCSKKVLFLD